MGWKNSKLTGRRHRWKRRWRTWRARESGLGIEMPCPKAWHSTLCSAFSSTDSRIFFFFFFFISRRWIELNLQLKVLRSTFSDLNDWEREREIGGWIACVQSVFCLAQISVSVNCFFFFLFFSSFVAIQINNFHFKYEDKNWNISAKFS